MSIDVGSRIGAYEVVAFLGEGGMGRVFRAHDTRLKRDVAIKMLHADVANDTDRVARFRREAETLAALSHPHIASIHDVVEWEGAQFLVLELVEGETLASLIDRGRVPVRDALTIAAQITEALEAAHGAGIVHRDLKPANVKITSQGHVKVLDFGLAKGGVSDAHPGLTHSPTVTAHATAGGVILGTASYMSPEQARGQVVDAQSDIWAFGCLLYEMLTRKRAFAGPTVTDVLAAVVRADVEWAHLPADTPVSVRRLLRRCLQKDRGQRLHHIADARIEIEETLRDPSSSEAPPASTQGRTRLPWIAAGVLLVIASGLAVALMFARGQATVFPPEMRLEITTPPTLDPIYVALSPDARTLAFVATTETGSSIWIRSLADTTPRPLPGTELATGPFWSPDGRSLGFFSDGKLKRIDLAGGITTTLASAPVGGGGAWTRDGIILYAPNAVSPLFRVSAAGGEPVAVTQLAAGQTGHRVPQFLPDHRRFFFYARGTPETRGLYVGSLDGAAPHRITDADWASVLTASGHVLFVRQSTLFAQPFNADRLELSGEPVPITDRVAVDSSSSAAGVTASQVGPFAYRSGGPGGERQLTWFDRGGKRLRTITAAETTALLNPELSPDGEVVAVNRTINAYQDVWQVETVRGIFRRLTFDPLADQIPVWTPDGQRIIFGSNRNGGIYNLYIKHVDGSEEVLLETSQNKFPMNVSADGKFLLYRVTSANTNWDLWALPLDAKAETRKPFPVVQTSFQELIGELSPDGRWVAYQTNESGQYEVYVQPFPQGGARTQVSTAGGSQPRWRRDGRELFYVGLDSRLMAASIAVSPSGQAQSGVPVALFVMRTPGGPVPTPQKQQYAVSADGQRFLVNSLTDEATASPITVILNWAPPR